MRNAATPAFLYVDTPQYGQLVRFGATTLCYLSQEGTPETLAFVETDNQHLITDVGTITLTSQPQSY